MAAAGREGLIARSGGGLPMKLLWGDWRRPFKGPAAVQLLILRPLKVFGFQVLSRAAVGTDAHGGPE